MRYVITIGRILISVGVFIALRREASRQLIGAIEEFGTLLPGAVDAPAAQVARGVEIATDTMALAS